MNEGVPSSRTLRIAAHISAAEWGGAERRSLILLASLAARGHVTRVFCNHELIAERARQSGLDAVISPLRGDIMVHHAFALAARLREFRPDVLILVTFRRLLLGALAARMARVPRTIARVGLASDVARSAKYRFVLKRWIDDVVVNAQSLITPFVASLPPRSHVRVTAIPNGVAVRNADVTRDQARTRLGLPTDSFVIGTVARLVKQKRVDRIVRVLHALRTANVHAAVAGAGYERDRLEALAADLDVTGRLHLLGHREDVDTVHRALDLYLVTSDQEGMSSGMLEALAAGVPVVSTPVSGAAEVLTAAPQTGVLVPADVAAITAAVEDLMTDDARRGRMAAAAAHVVASRYSVQRMVDAWEAFLLGTRWASTV